MVQLQRYYVKKLLLYTLVGLLFQPSYAFANDTNTLEQSFIKHKVDVPKGDLKRVSYTKQLIEYMYKFDQKIRQDLVKDQNNYKLQALQKEMDAFHTTKMKEILKEYGWITVSKFGSEYDQKAWLLVQHADDDQFFQAGVLFILSTLIDKGETSKKNYAYLYDRVAGKFHQIGMLQKYGTQVSIKDNGEVKLETFEGRLEDIDSRRKEIGLEPLSEYLKMIREFYIP